MSKKECIIYGENVVGNGNCFYSSVIQALDSANLWNKLFPFRPKNPSSLRFILQECLKNNSYNSQKKLEEYTRNLIALYEGQKDETLGNDILYEIEMNIAQNSRDQQNQNKDFLQNYFNRLSFKKQKEFLKFFKSMYIEKLTKKAYYSDYIDTHLLQHFLMNKFKIHFHIIYKHDMDLMRENFPHQCKSHILQHQQPQFYYNSIIQNFKNKNMDGINFKTLENEEIPKSSFLLLLDKNHYNSTIIESDIFSGTIIPIKYVLQLFSPKNKYQHVVKICKNGKRERNNTFSRDQNNVAINAQRNRLDYFEMKKDQEKRNAEIAKLYASYNSPQVAKKIEEPNVLQKPKMNSFSLPKKYVYNQNTDSQKHKTEKEIMNNNAKLAMSLQRKFNYGLSEMNNQSETLRKKQINNNANLARKLQEELNKSPESMHFSRKSPRNSGALHFAKQEIRNL